MPLHILKAYVKQMGQVGFEFELELFEEFLTVIAKLTQPG